MGPGTVTFCNAIDTTASFSITETSVLRLTANDNDLIYGDEVTITVNSSTITDLDLIFAKDNQKAGMRFRGHYYGDG